MLVKITNSNSLLELKIMASSSVDLTVTSPPYDNIRTYNNSLDWGEHVWKPIIYELHRITKEGGVVVWVVGDATIKGSETGTSFKQSLYAMECGFNLHDTMIYSKGGQGATGSRLCYWQDFEYMFIWSRGKPRALNFICDRKNLMKPRVKIESQGHRNQDGSKKGRRVIERKSHGRRLNIWKYHENGTRIDHPAVFPLSLAQDHIKSWSNEGDVVLDPFMGSGTTGVACVNLNRQFIGIEKDDKYYEIAKKRIQEAEDSFGLFNIKTK